MPPLFVRAVSDPLLHDTATSVLRGVDGKPLAAVDAVSGLAAQDAMEQLSPAAADERVSLDVFELAGKLFETSEIEGQGPEEYVRAVTLGTGLPSAVVRRGLTQLGGGLARAHAANAAELPVAVHGIDEHGVNEHGINKHRVDAGIGYRVEWVRRAGCLAVVAPSNHPEPHLAWTRALALGYAVAVRPGGRDPFTPLRLGRALLAAGLPANRLAVLPGNQATGTQLLRAAPLGIVYGGSDAARRWSGRGNVLVRGPGRSKAALSGPADVATLDHLARAIGADGGSRCTNLSSLFTWHDPGVLAEDLAERLAGWPVLPGLDPDARLPLLDRERCAGLRATLTEFAEAGFTDHSSLRYGGDPFVELEDGSYCVRPVILQAPDAAHPLVGTELPFPFAVVAPWDGLLEPLRDALVLNLIDPAPGLADRALALPGVRRVVVGKVDPWYTRSDLPHDGSLTGFLMEPKASLWEQE
jgi:acyl-CoA reductase-like NAD-dependent aldehyde dehydrogenase